MAGHAMPFPPETSFVGGGMEQGSYLTALYKRDYYPGIIEGEGLVSESSTHGRRVPMRGDGWFLLSSVRALHLETAQQKDSREEAPGLTQNNK
ncbi:uncharacterized protein BBA_00789 [Beauveria bassiana ARSEF 2860]|uniref:Uncharacterized protein n=1 Tax=Beauveria bassiana (strain ARSEF 2860) TaxID=655819 RepID=J4WJD8_BEAB2|nr:uncharacterized protein BBA_00789 [Beauveria bassiana ARSEF 2860]EJP69920.1 hypothetical protein BBA_00789 [Beauveria bassiana ARSEF 2860]